MDFYLTAPNGQRIMFPFPPEQVVAETEARVLVIETIELGEAGFPRGIRLSRISWEGILPGEARRNMSIVKAWRPPNEILHQLQLWRNAGTKLRLLVTRTPLNLDVYIERLEHRWGSGYGDMHYSISFVAARDLRVYTETEWKQRLAANTKTSAVRTRPRPPLPKTYTVRPGDSLWIIAKKILGNGARWREIYALNKSTIGPDPNKIKPGQVLRLPV